MKIARYLDVVKNLDDLNIIDQMISTFNSQRIWQFQGSTHSSKSAFFMSYLNQQEVNLFFQSLYPLVKDYNPNKNYTLHRAYINCNPPYVGGDWHTDGINGITVLYYPNSELNLSNNGGTEFEHHGVEKYINNSIIIFPADCLHRAIEHTTPGKYRFSIAFKLEERNM